MQKLSNFQVRELETFRRVVEQAAFQMQRLIRLQVPEIETFRRVAEQAKFQARQFVHFQVPELEKFRRLTQEVGLQMEAVRQLTELVQGHNEQRPLENTHFVEGRGDVRETKIARLYDELALLAERRVAGELDVALKSEIVRKFQELRRLQALQAAEIKKRFRKRLGLSEERLGRLDRAERLLRDHARTSDSDNASE
jgi:hypothetical protein